MIQIRTEGNALDLPSNFSIDIEDSNPIFNDQGSQSIPATVPATRRNIRLLDAPHRLDTGRDPNNPIRKADVTEGAYIRRGTLNVTEASLKDGITFNIGFDNSEIYSRLSTLKLKDLSDLPVMEAPEGQGEPVQNLMDKLYKIYSSPDIYTDDFAVFPLVLSNETKDSNSSQIYWEIMNVPTNGRLFQPTTIKRLIDGEATDVTVPEGYMVSPFLRVWRVLELIFQDQGYDIETNPFKEDAELARLVVLNNSVDAICRAEINYADLLPDCTCEEFLTALWVRFGLVYNIDTSSEMVTLRLIRDIVSDCRVSALDSYVAGKEKITFEERQYIKLSAQTSIEGAEPSTERFEDFVKGIDISDIHLGTSIASWHNQGDAQDPHWDGDWNDSYWDDYDPYDDIEDPDIPDPDPDDRDDEYDTRSGVVAQASAPVTYSDDPYDMPDSKMLAREFVTGAWYKLDAINGKTQLSSSSFFDWDPQPEGLTALDLSSSDECIPIAYVNNYLSICGPYISDYCPFYLYGSRHFHSYIKGSDNSDDNGGETPLAFLFAYTVNKKTIGRVTPEGTNGQSLTLDDGSRPKISLLFQFKDGLFYNFWRQYDEMLRHDNRSVEVSVRFNKMSLPSINLLDTYTFKGVHALIDTMSYSLPAGKEVIADLKLRTIQPMGIYDIDAEQNVPDFAAAARKIVWALHSETFSSALNTDALRQKVLTQYIALTGYNPRGSEGDIYKLGLESIVFRYMVRVAPTWETDDSLTPPITNGLMTQRTYKAQLTYDIYEIHDMSTSTDPDNWELCADPIDQMKIETEYTAYLYSKFELV